MLGSPALPHPDSGPWAPRLPSCQCPLGHTYSSCLPQEVKGQGLWPLGDVQAQGLLGFIASRALSSGRARGDQCWRWTAEVHRKSRGEAQAVWLVTVT